MPVFTFEKISPSTDGGLVPGTAENESTKTQSTKTQTANSQANDNQSKSKKQRGRIVQFLDRFVETRVNKSLRKQRSVAGKTSKA
jgi:hypothetical protein